MLIDASKRQFTNESSTKQTLLPLNQLQVQTYKFQERTLSLTAPLGLRRLELKHMEVVEWSARFEFDAY